MLGCLADLLDGLLKADVYINVCLFGSLLRLLLILPRRMPD